MKLDAFLRQHRLTSAQFAEAAGLERKQVVHNYRHGLRFPTPENLRRIRDATGGAVTADDFVDQHVGESTPTVPTRKPRRKRASLPPPPTTEAAE